MASCATSCNYYFHLFPRLKINRGGLLSNITLAPGSRLAAPTKNPNAIIELIKAEPPYEMNGKGTPTTGNIPTTDAMLIVAWTLIHAIIPATA